MFHLIRKLSPLSIRLTPQFLHSSHQSPKQPQPFQFYPMFQRLLTDETFYWCSCGMSVNQPMCDGRHKGTIFRPVKFTVPKSGTYALCGCKYNKRSSGEKCDGSCIKNLFLTKVLRRELYKEIPIPKDKDADGRVELKRWLHVRDEDS